MCEKPQRVMTDRGSGAKQDHRDALKRNGMIARRQRVGRRCFPLHEGERAITRCQCTARKIEQSGTVLVRDFRAIDTEPPFEHLTLGGWAVRRAQQQHSVTIGTVPPYATC